MAMKRLVCAFALAGALMAGVDALAQVTGEAVVTTTSARVRLKPSETALVIESVGLGVVLPVVGQEGGWLRVSLPATAAGLLREGYIATRLVDFRPAAAPAATPAAQAALASSAGVAATKEPAPAPAEAEPAAPLSPEALLERGQEVLQKAVHGGYANNAAYWRQVAKVTKALEHRHERKFNLVSPIIEDELKLADRIVPKRTKDPVADMAAYRDLAANAIARIDADGPVINWQMTLGGVEPEKNPMTRIVRRAAVVGVYAINPVAGAAVSAANRRK